MDRRAVLEERLACEELEIRVLNPPVDHRLIGQPMQMLQIHQARNQPWWRGWPSRRRREEPGPFVVEEVPIDQISQLHQFMAHVDQIDEAGTQQFFLF